MPKPKGSKKKRSNCPHDCPCICHDTGGSGHDHPGMSCKDWRKSQRPKKKLKRYLVRGIVGVSVSKEVLATSPEAAIEKVGDLQLPTFCIECSEAGQHQPTEWGFNGELDGDVADITVEPLGD